MGKGKGKFNKLLYKANPGISILKFFSTSIKNFINILFFSKVKLPGNCSINHYI
jgi:hypothetical protein